MGGPSKARQIIAPPSHCPHLPCSLQKQKDQSQKSCTQAGWGHPKVGEQQFRCSTDTGPPARSASPVPEVGSPTQAPRAGPLQPWGSPGAPAATSTAGPLDMNSDLVEVVAGNSRIRRPLAASHHFAELSSGPRLASD